MNYKDQLKYFGIQLQNIGNQIQKLGIQMPKTMYKISSQLQAMGIQILKIGKNISDLQNLFIPLNKIKDNSYNLRAIPNKNSFEPNSLKVINSSNNSNYNKSELKSFNVLFYNGLRKRISIASTSQNTLEEIIHQYLKQIGENPYNSMEKYNYSYKGNLIPSNYKIKLKDFGDFIYETFPSLVVTIRKPQNYENNKNQLFIY